MQYYHKCLNNESLLAGADTVKEGHEMPMQDATLKREAAFNLSLIYRGTGADDLARQVLQQHVTI